jgi:CBS domain-containing protein
MSVRNYMTPDPIVVTPETTVAEIARQLTLHRIGCVPVVDAEGRLVGLVTETDLFVRESVVPFSNFRSPTLMGDWVDPDRIEQTYRDLGDRKASDVMTTALVTVDVDLPIGQAARLMMQLERNHLPVVSSGRLVGILTRHDVLRALCQRLSA